MTPNSQATRQFYFLMIAVLMGTLAHFGPAHAEEKSELAKRAQNPVADLISIPLQNNTNFGLEPNLRTQNILNIQPVIPFNLSDEWNLITRTIMPIIKQPDLSTTSDDTWGLGDITMSFFISCVRRSDQTGPFGYNWLYYSQNLYFGLGGVTTMLLPNRKAISWGEKK